MKKVLSRGGAVLLLSLTLAACGNGEEDPAVNKRDTAELSVAIDGGGKLNSGAVEGRELIALTDSEEEAQLIADQYGITLVVYAQGVATFHTEEDPQEVIKRGEENDLPKLYLNTTHELIE
ncbi:MAG: hypothetical protein IK115_02835 [Lachnospiraceae bacterium]|nr:hypothetical protein [Lachnospiraceae bacterium]